MWTCAVCGDTAVETDDIMQRFRDGKVPCLACYDRATDRAARLTHRLQREVAQAVNEVTGKD